MDRRFFVLCAATLMMASLSADAAERFTFDKKQFQAAVDARKPVLVHITAPWCPECKQQKPIVASLADQSDFKDLIIFDVDFDTQKDALQQLKVLKESTLIVYRDRAEVGRATGITKPAVIESLIRKAL